MLRSQGIRSCGPPWGPRPMNRLRRSSGAGRWLRGGFLPPTNWFHQHFIPGRSERAAGLVRSQSFPGIRVAAIRAGVYTSSTGRHLIEYETRSSDAQTYEAELAGRHRVDMIRWPRPRRLTILAGPRIKGKSLTFPIVKNHIEDQPMAFAVARIFQTQFQRPPVKIILLI